MSLLSCRLRLGSVVVLAATTLACGTKTNPNLNCPSLPAAKVSYAQVSQTVFTTCRGCHSAEIPVNQRLGATTTVNFDTYQECVDYAEEARLRVMGLTMPPGSVHRPNLSSACLLNAWVEQGTPP